MKTRIKYFYNLLNSYKKMLFKVIFFEIFYSIKNLEIVPLIKSHESDFSTDTVPCIYYFLYEITKFVKEYKISSVLDVGSGYGRVVNFIYDRSNIEVRGIELDEEVFNKSLTLKRNKIKIYNGDIFDLEAHKIDVDCYILIDPLKKKEDKKRLLIKIKNLKKKKFIIAVNMSEEIFSEDFILIKSIKASDARSLYFFKLN